MQTWFNCIINYLKIDDDGRERKVSEAYLVDAVNYTDAEARIINQCETFIRGEFRIKKITQTAIVEIFPDDRCEMFFIGKISIVTIDEKMGKEKMITNQFLVAAGDIEEALKNLKDGLSYVLVPFHITSIAVSNIVDVFPYFEEASSTTSKAEFIKLIDEPENEE